jgi:hypothetical protein
MKLVRNVVHDLVEKKLWPVAIALAGGLVAVPIVLGGSSDAGTPAGDVARVPAVNGAANHRDAARAQVVSLEQQAAGAVKRDGAVRNPFVQHHVPKAPKSPVAVTNTAVQATKSLLSGLGGSPTPASTGGSTPTVGSTPAPATGGTGTTPGTGTPSTQATYGVSLRFGEAGTEKVYNNVARLTPLPSSTNPFFVYLGLSNDGKSAVFLVDGGAVPTGDGTCKPSSDQCEQILLKKGDVEFFEMQSGTAGVVQYQLELTSIAKSTAASKASAAKAHARESRAGREYLRQIVAENPSALAGWSFSTQLGLLVETAPATTADVANLPKDVAAMAAGQQVSTATPAYTPVP